MINNILLFRVKNILGNPDKEWETIDSENRSVDSIRNQLLIPLIFIVSIASFAGSLMYTNAEMPMVYSLFTAIQCFLLFLISVYATSFILKEITYSLDLGRDFSTSFRLIIFSIIPFLLCQIMSRFFESLLFVNILSLYGLYIFWTGSEKLLSPPSNKKLPLLIATTISFTIIFIGSDLLLKKLMDKIFFLFFS